MSKINKQSLQKAGGVVLAIAIAGITGYLLSESMNNKKMALNSKTDRNLNSKKIAKDGKPNKKASKKKQQQAK